MAAPLLPNFKLPRVGNEDEPQRILLNKYLQNIHDNIGGGSSPLTTKGDLFGFDTADARIPVGPNGDVLTADSTQALGVKWAAAASSGVTAVTATSPIVSSGGTTPNISILSSAFSPLPAIFQFSAGGSSLQAGGITTSAEARTVGTIASWVMFVRADDPTVTCVVDVFKTSEGGYGAGSSITGSAKPTLTAAVTANSFTLTGWTTAISVGDVFYAKIVSLTGNIKGLTLELRT